jgi:hypothetical protein
MTIFANFKYKKMGSKIVKMIQNFTCSCFSCIYRDIGVGRKILRTFLKNGSPYCTVPSTKILLDGTVPSTKFLLDVMRKESYVKKFFTTPGSVKGRIYTSSIVNRLGANVKINCGQSPTRKTKDDNTIPGSPDKKQKVNKTFSPI